MDAKHLESKHLLGRKDPDDLINGKRAESERLRIFRIDDDNLLDAFAINHFMRITRKLCKELQLCRFVSIKTSVRLDVFRIEIRENAHVVMNPSMTMLDDAFTRRLHDRARRAAARNGAPARRGR